MGTDVSGLRSWAKGWSGDSLQLLVSWSGARMQNLRNTPTQTLNRKERAQASGKKSRMPCGMSVL